MADVGQLAQEVQSEMTASAASSTSVYSDTLSVEPDNTLPSSSEPGTSTSHYTELEPGAVLEMNISSATQSTVSSSPNDLGTNEPKQPELAQYPSTMHGKKLRRFQKAWYTGRPWLEYSVTLDACFCYCCRKFTKDSDRDADPCFVSSGFRNWKIALEEGRGLIKHESSKNHVNAALRWAERDLRKDRNLTIESQLSSSQVEKNRYYIKSIAEVVQFLAVNELSFRGDKESAEESNDCDRDNIGGLFVRLFEFAMQKDARLHSIAKSMPKNAKYTSPDIQNEVINIMARMVQEVIVKECTVSDIGRFCIKCDETRDATNIEDMSVVLRYVKEGVTVERLLSVVDMKAVDANSITEAIIQELKSHSLDPARILSQCYDGASVMSGSKGGVQKLLQEKLGKAIPYVHCLNHQLHLVVVHAMEAVPQAKKFFLLCEHLYVFFRRHFMSSIYDGQSLKRLLEQRWTGHLQCSLAIKNNRQEILDALEVASESDTVGADVSVEAGGLLAKVSQPEFAFMAAVAVKVLSLLTPANSMMQAKSCNMMQAAELLACAKDNILELRSDKHFQQFAEDAGMKRDDQKRVQRTVKQNRFLTNYVITSTLGHSHTTETDNTSRHTSTWDGTKRAYFSLLDSVAGELSARFGESNVALLQSVEALLPASEVFMQLEAIKPVADLLQLHSDTVAAELSVGSAFLLKKLPSDTSLASAAQMMLQFKDAFPNIFSLYAAALTIGISTATCENSFSTLTRVLNPRRRSMTHERKAQLVLLAFEKQLTRQIDLDQFVAEFNTSTRHIAL